MKNKLLIVLFVSFFPVFGCGNTMLNTKPSETKSSAEQEKSTQVASIDPKYFLGYQPINPIPASKVKDFDATTNSEKEKFWKALPQKKARELLPLQTAQFAVRKIDVSGKVSYLVSSVSGERGSYEVTMDYMKYRVEDKYGYDGDYLGNVRVGVGLRITAVVVTNKANLNLGSIAAIGVEAKMENLSGGISVDVIGIDSEAVTNLIPLTSEIDQTAIQSALQALASIKSKLWDEDITITPHVVAIQQSKPEQIDKIRKEVSVYMKSDAGDALRRYWKPDGKNINKENQAKLKKWMEENGLSVGPGSITMFIRAATYECKRQQAVKDLKLK